MSHSIEHRLKEVALTGLDLYATLLVASVLLVPYSLVARAIFEVLSGTGGAVYFIGVGSLAVVSFVTQLAAVGWVWEMMNREEWLPSSMIE